MSIAAASKRIWSLCHVLRDDGIVYHKYLSELTYLLFLKVASETGREDLLPKGCRWNDLVDHSGRGMLKPYLEVYDRQLRQGKDPGLKRLFYALPVHSQFVLLAFLIQQSEEVREFLTHHLGIDPDEGIESVLFVLRQPPWHSPKGDPRFWNAKGVVADFLDRLQRIALAPIEATRRVDVSLWSKETLQFKYLYIKDIASLRELVGTQRPAEFFRDMESTHVSQLIEEVRIRVRLKKSDGTVTFRELSEGEQQLLRRRRR